MLWTKTFLSTYNILSEVMSAYLMRESTYDLFCSRKLLCHYVVAYDYVIAYDYVVGYVMIM